MYKGQGASVAESTEQAHSTAEWVQSPIRTQHIHVSVNALPKVVGFLRFPPIGNRMLGLEFDVRYLSLALSVRWWIKIRTGTRSRAWLITPPSIFPSITVNFNFTKNCRYPDKEFG